MSALTLTAATAIIDNNRIISPACLEVENGLITRISQTPQRKAHEHIDLGNMVLLPGFVNAHCHLELTAIGPLPEKRFVPWIKTLMQRKQDLNREAIIDSVRHGIYLNLQSGCTTILDHVSFDTPLEAFADAPAQVVAFGEVIGTTKELATLTHGQCRKNQGTAPLPFHLTPHAIHSVAPDILRTLFASRQGPFSIHLGESRDELDYFQSHSGDLWDFIKQRRPDIATSPLHPEASALRYIHNHGFDLNDSLLIHMNHSDETDVKIMRTWKNVCIVHCPGSFHFFNHGSFPFESYRSSNLPLALGTDSLASNSGLNLLHEIQLFLRDHPGIGIFDLLPMVTTNACQAIGLKGTGMISEGYRADLIGFATAGKKDVLEVLQEKSQVDFCLSGGRVLRPFI